MKNGIFTVEPPDRHDLSLGRARQKGVLASLPLDSNRKVIAAMKGASRKISGVPVRTRLQGFLQRISSGGLNPSNSVFAKSFLEGALNSLDTEDHNKEIAGMVAAARAGDLEQKAALGKRVAVNVGHLIRSVGQWVQWYDYITLADDETPWLRNFVPQQIDVRIANADGTLTTRKALPNVEDNNPVDLYFLLSDMFTAKMFDPNRGDVSAAALGTIDIALDVMEKLEGLLQLPFTVGTPNSVFTAAFTSDGTAASHYHASSRINTGNFPAGNIISPASNSGSTKPRYDCIRAIDEYFGRFGSGFDPAGDMVGVEIRIASGIAHQFGDEFTPTSTTNPYADGLHRNRGIVECNGKQYVITPDPTIDPADKHMYVRSNLPAGLHFEKPGGALVHREERPFPENEVETCERILVGQAFPVTYAPRALAVKFKT